jgi:hypothetical protein
VAPGQTIQNNGIARGYCLEYNQPVLQKGNIGKLVEKSGDVIATFKNGTTQTFKIDDLVKNKDIEIIALNSFESIKLSFLNDSLEKITILDEGVTLWREGILPAERELAEKNISIILELEKTGKTSHYENQHIAWNTLNPHEESVLVLNDHPIDKIESTYGGSGTVRMVNPNISVNICFDGLPDNTDDPNVPQVVFLTHYHQDHITENQIRELFLRKNYVLVYPIPSLEVSKNATYQYILNSDAYKTIA